MRRPLALKNFDLFMGEEKEMLLSLSIKTYSAIAAMTTAEFLDCITICDTACTSDSIQAFLDGLRPPFVSTTSGITNILICITNSLRLQTM